MTIPGDPLLAPLRFGRFELNAAARELRADGEPVPIGARAFDLLAALAAHRQRVLGRSELLDLVWPGLVVEEGNLAVQVSGLRKLLGAQVIATIPGRGYRFVAPLDEPGGPAGAPQRLPNEPARKTDNLPASPGPLHGREEDLRALEGLLAAQRLVTVVGPGGIGKTRLALELAHRHSARMAEGAEGAAGAGGVWWVELAPIAEGRYLVPTLAAVLGFDLAGAADPSAALLRALAALKALKALIVLDNCEHLAGEVTALVRDGLRHAPAVRWLITTQEPLKLPLECVYRLGTLAVPPEGASAEQALTHGAVALLVERAHAAERRFGLTAANVGAAIAICRELDGVALAIEMAAARVPLLGLAGVREKLGERLRLLNVPGGLFRSQTLRGALEWSHSLLGADEQLVFRRLAVFVGGFSLPLAQAVVGGDSDSDGVDEWTFLDALGALVDKSLVIADGQDAPRYRLLETTRAYALERLAQAGETEALGRRHARAVADEMVRSTSSTWTTPEAAWLAQMAPEIGNLRAAFEHAMANGLTEEATTLATDGFLMCSLLDQFVEGRQRLASIHPLLETVPAELAARAWFALGCFGDALFEGRLEAMARALDRYRSLDDRQGIYKAAAVFAELLARNGRVDEAAPLLAQARALEDRAWPPRLRAVLPNSAAFVAEARGDIDAAVRDMREAAALDRAAGWSSRVAAKLSNLVAILLAAGRTAEAIAVGEELLALQAGGQPIPGLAYMNLAGALILEGRLAQAHQISRIGLPLMQRKGQAHIYLDHLALLAAKEGRLLDAARLVGWADARYEAHRTRRDTEEVQARALALERIAAATGPEACERARREGAALGEDEAVTLALAQPPVGS